MAFPTIPTTGTSRIIATPRADTTSPRTFASTGGLTKVAGDLLIAIAICYQTSTGTNAAFSSWSDGFTEFHDSATSTTMAIGCAYKFSDGTENVNLTVAQATTITGHAALIIMSIEGVHPSTPPEAGGRVSSTNATMADATSLAPSWGAEDTLWIAVGGDGETSGTGSYTAIASAPTNYTDLVESGITQDVVGGVEGAVAFRQLNASSEDAGAWTADTSNARHAALLIAVRPAPGLALNRFKGVQINQAVNRAATW
jgi:hypothetical protein